MRQYEGQQMFEKKIRNAVNDKDIGSVLNPAE